MKIAFNVKPKSSPWGGGNQFLEQFTCFLKSQGHSVVYKLDKNLSHIFIVKSWDGPDTLFGIEKIIDFKKKYPHVKCIHRINECDMRKGTDFVNERLRMANQAADFTVFISAWLKDYFSRRWFDVRKPSAVIYNGADPKVFFPDLKDGYSGSGVFNIVTHHWSDNWMKGFKVYEELDRMIADYQLKDFSFMVIGRWPKEITWRSAKVYRPARANKLADLLRMNHIYLTASLWEPCGMHHVEGAQCGLPLVYHEDGGGIVEFGRKYGISFRDNLKQALLDARDNYPELRKKVISEAPSGAKMCRDYASLLKI